VRYFVALLALFEVACWGAGDPYLEDGLDCSTMPCEDRLDIKITRFDKDAFPTGGYTFTLTPIADSPIEVACSVENDAELDCDSASNLPELSLNGSSTEFTVRFSFAPSSIDIEVYFEDQFLGEATLSPDYMTVMPNGPECDPICFQASVSMEVSAPQV
jgi:hypothetical protein